MGVSGLTQTDCCHTNSTRQGNQHCSLKKRDVLLLANVGGVKKKKRARHCDTHGIGLHYHHPPPPPTSTIITIDSFVSY